MNNLTAQQVAAILITHHEAFKAKVYPDPFDPKKFSVGWGTSFINNIPVAPSLPDVTKAKAIVWVYKYINQAVLDIIVPRYTSPYELGALISLAYNVGIKPVADSTLVKYLNAGETVRAACEFPQWCLNMGTMKHSLLQRRLSEMYTFLSGEFMFDRTDDYLLINQETT